MTETWTILKMLEWMSGYFSLRDIESPRLESELLLSFGLSLTRVQLYTQFDRPLNEEELQKIKDLVRRRAAREPLAYIRGVKEFYSLEFVVSPAVLIPRPETEILVEEGCKWISSLVPSPSQGEGQKILDIGTGSGCIAIALAKLLAEAQVWAADVSEEALRLAEQNAIKHKVDDRLHWVGWDLRKDPWKGPPEKFHLIVSNPPYVPTDQIAGLAPELQYEPRAALDGGAKGLDFYRVLIPWSLSHFEEGGGLLVEIGEDQTESLQEMALRSGFRECALLTDFAGKTRVLKMN